MMEEKEDIRWRGISATKSPEVQDFDLDDRCSCPMRKQAISEFF